MTPPADELLALYRDKLLVERYPEVRRLLTTMPADRLPTAGRLLATLDVDEVLARHPQVPVVTVCVTGHGTVSPLIPLLAAEFARHGLLLRAVVSEFDSYVFDLSDPHSDLYATDPDIVLCVLDPAVVFDEMPAPWRPSDVERVLAEKVDLLRGLSKRFHDNARGVLVMNTLPLPRQHTRQLIDLKSRGRLGILWRNANARLLGIAEDVPSTVVVDLDPLIADGVAVTDPRMDVYAKVHLSQDLLAGYARDVGHLARAITGRAKKCLVVDLDDTLWGGILGEDGIDGVEVGDTLRGNAFTAFQDVVKQIGSQGVLLAAVSKNDAEPVRDMFAHHPAMVLREDDFVRVTANWQPKHDNLTALAEDLGLGVDSFVFADDSPFERGLVRHALPDVAVVDLDGEPALHTVRLLEDGWFDVRELTTEDANRPAAYRAELERRDFAQGFDSLGGYLRELGVWVRIADADERDVPRISQLTLRTNQFNMTTERLQPPQVLSLTNESTARVLSLRTGDRFGENGLVGAVFLRRTGDTLHIGNFLLSCRVFSRGIEHACLTAVLRHAKASGAREVVGTYRRSAKNGKVRDFYPDNGFKLRTEEPAAAVFRHDLVDIAAPPEHVQVIASLEGTVP